MMGTDARDFLQDLARRMGERSQLAGRGTTRLSAGLFALAHLLS